MKQLVFCVPIIAKLRSKGQYSQIKINIKLIIEGIEKEILYLYVLIIRSKPNKILEKPESKN